MTYTRVYFALLAAIALCFLADIASCAQITSSVWSGQNCSGTLNVSSSLTAPICLGTPGRYALEDCNGTDVVIATCSDSACSNCTGRVQVASSCSGTVKLECSGPPPSGRTAVYETYSAQGCAGAAAATITYSLPSCIGTSVNLNGVQVQGILTDCYGSSYITSYCTDTACANCYSPLTSLISGVCNSVIKVTCDSFANPSSYTWLKSQSGFASYLAPSAFAVVAAVAFAF